jgi:hypothetical protein
MYARKQQLLLCVLCGCDDSPQLELEYREITEDREEKVRIIEVGSLDHQIIGKLVETKICTFKRSKCVF